MLALLAHPINGLDSKIYVAYVGTLKIQTSIWYKACINNKQYIHKRLTLSYFLSSMESHTAFLRLVEVPVSWLFGGKYQNEAVDKYS